MWPSQSLKHGQVPWVQSIVCFDTGHQPGPSCHLSNPGCLLALPLMPPCNCLGLVLMLGAEGRGEGRRDVPGSISAPWLKKETRTWRAPPRVGTRDRTTSYTPQILLLQPFWGRSHTFQGVQMARWNFRAIGQVATAAPLP